MYSVGASEEVTGRALREYARLEECVVPTVVSSPHMRAEPPHPVEHALCVVQLGSALDDSDLERFLERLLGGDMRAEPFCGAALGGNGVGAVQCDQRVGNDECTNRLSRAQVQYCGGSRRD